MNTDEDKTFDKKKFAIFAVILIAVAYVGFDLFWSYTQQRRQRIKRAITNQKNERAVQQIVSSEELLLELTPQLRPLSRSVLNLQLPDTSARNVFADRVDLSGMIAIDNEPSDSITPQLSRPWRIENRNEVVSREDISLWKPFLAETEYFENAGFYFVRGQLEAGDFDQFHSVVGFDGLAVYRDGREASLHAQLDVDWTRQKSVSDNGTEWRISSWQLTDLSTLETSGRLFKDVLKNVLADREILRRATKSRHSEVTSSLIRGKDYFLPKGITYPFFFPDVTLEHPGVAIVDINDDGFDDLYVAMQHGPNFLFRNNADGTFEEVAAEYGLDIAGDSTSAIFADFDNDSDPDLFLGRARQPALYLVNNDGRFVDQSTQRINCNLPGLVSSISAADYNSDGLLDVYLCTYSPIEPGDVQKQKTPLWVSHFLSGSQAAQFARLNKNSHKFLSLTGPPNVLLKNVGDGKFELAEENKQLELWRMTFQASWSDFDGDGDPDVYVSNDYAPDNFLRNDGADGFKDITKESGLTGMGFGMGVSWGDYDNDGLFDVYVSNMHSKAGQRITSQVTGIDPRLREMAAGNFLYRRENDGFKQVSGFEESDLQVAKAGWSWGGQFFDFNNDGFRDIYVVSGYYTAPPDVAIDIDL